MSSYSPSRLGAPKDSWAVVGFVVSIEAMRAEEERLDCKITDREREGFARGVHAPEHRVELRRLAALDVEPLDEHEGRL
jgi:hypothetical protein